MKNSFLKKYFPDPQSVIKSPALKPIQHLLQNRDLFHFNRKSSARAVFVGLFCSFIPLPSQMIIAAAFCWLLRCNIAIGVSLVWISNPITMGPIFYFAYKLGTWVLQLEPLPGGPDFGVDWLWQNLVSIGYPLIMGSFICGLAAGITGFIIVHFAWKSYIVLSWQRRKNKENP